MMGFSGVAHTRNRRCFLAHKRILVLTTRFTACSFVWKWSGGR